MMAKARELNGVFVPTLTFFSDDGASLDCKRIEEHIDYLIEAGVEGLVPNGTTGEYYALDRGEREMVADLTVRRSGARVPVVVGTTALTTAESVLLSRHAESVGAQGVMVAPPAFRPLTHDELCRHYEKIAEAISLPVMLYNNPSATGQHLTPELLVRLTDAAGIRYIKDSTASFEAFQQTQALMNGRVGVFMGEELLSVQALFMGAAGLIMGLGNVIPEVFVQLARLVEDGRYDKARALHYAMVPLYEFASSPAHGSYSCILKSAVKLRGRGDATATRLPALPLSPQHEESLGRVLADLNLA